MSGGINGTSLIVMLGLIKETLPFGCGGACKGRFDVT
jgi:hypothetical protein